MNDLPPIPMPKSPPGTPAVTPSSPVPAPAPPPSWPRWLWGYKHAAATLALALTVLAPYLAQWWPAAAPAVQQVQQLLTEPAPPAPKAPAQAMSMPTPAGPATSPYESAIRAAWTAETAPDKAASLSLMRYLFRRSRAEAISQGKDLDDLYKSFRARETALTLDRKLLKLRAAVRLEWAAQIPEVAPTPLTEPCRARLTDFLSQTLGILQRLP